MRTQRKLAMSLLVIAAVVFGYTSRAWLYPVVMCAVAAIGLTGRFGWTLRPGRRTILLLVMATVFAIKRRFMPFENPAVDGFLMYELAHAVGQYFLAVMALYFLLTPEKLPPIIMLCGVIILVCAGDVQLDSTGQRVYQILALLYAALAAVFCGTCRRPGRPAAGRTSGPPARHLVAAGVLATTLVASLAVASYLDEHDVRLTTVFGRFRPQTEGNGGGFPEEAELTTITRLRGAGSRQVALRVFARRRPGYLRGKIYHRFGRSSWRAGGRLRPIPPADPDRLPANLRMPDGPGNLFQVYRTEADRWRVMDVWPVPDMGDTTFAPLDTAVVKVPVESLSVNVHGILEPEKLSGGVNYAAAAPERRPPTSLDPAQRRRCTQIPRNLDERVRRLGEKILAPARTTVEKIAAVETYFHDNYKYRTGIRIPRGRDPLTFFLMDKPPAHCEYFASAAAVVLRLADVPTRYVTGFVAAEPGPGGEYWVARNKDAHAWVEAWDDQAGRWRIVEATPAGGVPDSKAPGTWAALWDHVVFRLQQLRVAMHVQGMRGLALWLLRRLAGLVELLLTTIPGQIVTTVLAFLIVWRLRRWLRRRGGRAVAAPENPTIAALHLLLNRMDRQLGAHGLVRAPAETLHRFAHRIAADAPSEAPADRLADWYVRYAHVRYGGVAGPQDVQRLAAAVPSE